MERFELIVKNNRISSIGRELWNRLYSENHSYKVSKVPIRNPLEIVLKLCITKVEMEVCMVEDEKSLMMPIIIYIEFGEQPQNKVEARRL